MSLLMQTDKVTMVDDISQTMTIRRGKMTYSQYYPPTHYPCPEMSSGSFIIDHLILSQPFVAELMEDVAPFDVLCDMVCGNRCDKDANPNPNPVDSYREENYES